ncbi:hypothetical protein PS423_01925 [Pediococcus acidilactici]|uniref:hypothetical protein n=1 Tax=Pediococcus acidilactici TaxID=1254 RepID=UPI002F26B972
MNVDAKVILERIESLFKRVPNTRYLINVVNDHFDQTYNFFFFIAKKKQRPHSIPLHSIKKYDLEYLEIVVNEIKKHYHLTLTYNGFSGQRWPN